MSNNRDMSKREIDKWNDTMKKKLALARGESIYEGEDIEGLMSSGSSGAIWKRYRDQESAKAENLAEIARVSKNVSPQDLSKAFKGIAESYGASLFPRMGWEAINKIVREKYALMMKESGIKEITIPKGYTRYEKLKTKEQFLEEKENKKQKKKGVYFEESEKETMLSFVEDLKKVLRRRVSSGALSQKEADKQVAEALRGLERDFGIARKDLGVGENKGLDIPESLLRNGHCDPDEILEYFWSHTDELTSSDDLLIVEAEKIMKKAAEVEKDLEKLSESDFIEKYSDE